MSFLICGRKKKKTWRVEHGVTPLPTPTPPRAHPRPQSPALPIWDSDLARMPYNASFEMSPEDFIIDRLRLWSEGRYSITHMGHITYDISVSPELELAVTIKKARQDAYANTQDREHIASVQALMREVRILSNIGAHENIVNLLGVNTTNLGLGDVLVALELCNGSPAEYLQSRPDQSGQIARWAAEIAAGMEYLARCRVVHTELALENIFLSTDSPPRAKVGCLEMACVLSADSDRFIFGESRHIRWKHASTEILTHQKFSTASDVWAYGVTIWELLSPGKAPYSDIHHWNSGFAEQLTAGLRPSQPEHISDKIFGMLECCWSEYPQLRPTFTELRTFFQSLNRDDEDLQRINRFFQTMYTGIAFGHYVPAQLVNNPAENA